MCVGAGGGVGVSSGSGVTVGTGVGNGAGVLGDGVATAAMVAVGRRAVGDGRVALVVGNAVGEGVVANWGTTVAVPSPPHAIINTVSKAAESKSKCAKWGR